MEYRKLGNTDMNVSIISFGASSLGSVFRATEDEESKRVVELVLEQGINYIDTAPWYGQGKSEMVLGQALKSIPRSKYFIATKVGRYELDAENMFDFSYNRTLLSVDESLKRLGLDYVDIIQAHDVEFAPSIDIVVNETLPALDQVVKAGKARYIGITGYPIETLKKIIERSQVQIDTVLSYCRYSMNDTTLLQYIDFFRDKGVGIINASPLSMGLLTNRGPPSWHPANNRPDIIAQCKKAAQYCQEKSVDISRLALHFSLLQPECPTCLVSTASEENARKNFVLNPLTKNEKAILDEVIEQFMKPLANANWEGIDVARYRKELEESQANK